MAADSKTSTTTYKSAFVEFIKNLEWDWFITIGIGACPDDDKVLRRLRLIEAILCKKYLLTRYHKLPDRDRFSMLVAFEGEKRLGTRHAHILVHIPQPRKKWTDRSMVVRLFCWEFRALWHRVTPPAERQESILSPKGRQKPLTFGRINAARTIYTVKSVQGVEIPWSRFEFVTPPKVRKFENENLSVIRDRDRQKCLGCAVFRTATQACLCAKNIFPETSVSHSVLHK
jgi:hypothetical protein